LAGWTQLDHYPEGNSRLNDVRALLEGKGLDGPEPFDALDLATRHGHARTLKGVVEFYAKLLLGVPTGTSGATGFSARPARKPGAHAPRSPTSGKGQDNVPTLSLVIGSRRRDHEGKMRREVERVRAGR